MASQDITAPTSLLDDLADMRGVPREVKKLAKRAKRHASGRPSKLTPALAARILTHVLAGSYLTVAADEAGVSVVTIRNWKRRAAAVLETAEDGVEIPEGEMIFIEFFRAIKMAEGGAELKLLKRASRGEKGWQAAMTVLERRAPDRWGRQEKRIIEGSEERPVVFSLEAPAERAKRVAKILDETGALEDSRPVEKIENGQVVPGQAVEKT